MKKLLVFLGALTAMTLSPAAQAAEFAVSLTDTVGAVSINALVTTSDTFTTGSDGRQGLLITAITGTRNSAEITGLLGTFDGTTLDNRIYADEIDTFGPVVSDVGVGFSVAGTSSIFNLFAERIVFPEFPNGLGFYGERERTAAGLVTTREFDLAASRISAVPEPAIWAMMILGFGLVGSALRRQKRRAAGGSLAHA